VAERTIVIFWISISTWLISKIFSLYDKTLLIAVSGILVANITFTALTATYIYELDSDIFASLVSVIMVFTWQKGGNISLIGIPCLIIVLALYQSMLSVAIALVMLVSIESFLDGKSAKSVVLKGLYAIALILISGAIYLLIVKLTCSAVDVDLTSSYNGLANLFISKGSLEDYLSLIILSYQQWCDAFIRSSRPFYVNFFLNSVLLLTFLCSLIRLLLSKKLSLINKLLTILLYLLLPLGINISSVADGGMVHDLMLYAVWLTYLSVLLITKRYYDFSNGKNILSPICRTAALIGVFLILAVNVQTANTAYIKKNLEAQATLSVMTTVNTQLLNIDEYIPGETNVVFLGTPQTGVEDYFEDTSKIIGLIGNSSITYYETYQFYFESVLKTPIKTVKSSLPADFTITMNCYPQAGYIQWYEDMLVVKFSN